MADLGGCKELCDMSEAELPCALNFTTEVEHRLTCTACQHSWTRSEILRHFSLDLPPSAGSHASGAPPNLQQLLMAFFNDDRVEVQCEKCDGCEATVRHRIAKLPRVLILHLKRFDSTLTGVKKPCSFNCPHRRRQFTEWMCPASAATVQPLLGNRSQ